MVRLTRQAREDLLEIWGYIAQHNEIAADRFYDRVLERCNQLAAFPELGPARPEIAPDVRSLTIERWLVLYRLTKDGVRIVRVVDGARDLQRMTGSRDLQP